jgi:hypothetical protein
MYTYAHCIHVVLILTSVHNTFIKVHLCSLYSCCFDFAARMTFVCNAATSQHKTWGLKSYIDRGTTTAFHGTVIYITAEHEISGLNPVPRSESLAAIFSRTDLIQKKKGQMPIAKLKYLVANGDRKFRALYYCNWGCDAAKTTKNSGTFERTCHLRLWGRRNALRPQRLKRT